MKKLLSIILAAGMLAGGTMVTKAEPKLETVTVELDGNLVYFPDAQPFIDTRDRTLVPIRFVSEAMGAKVDWVEDTRTVIINKDKDTIKYTIGDLKAYLNDEMCVFDSYGILKEDRTFVPLRFISEMLSCTVDWSDAARKVAIAMPGTAVKFPKPKLTVHYPESESDKRLLWITIDNYRDFERECPYYEFKIEFMNPKELNTFEQDEGEINGWQKYNRNEFVSLTKTGNTVVTVSRAFYTTRSNAKRFKIADGDGIKFKLTVHRKCSDETKEYTYNETIKMPYSLIKTEV